MRWCALLLILVFSASGADAADRNRPVVVELFTSQACNSCPPADAFLGELARRPDVLALSFHIDYWDYIGWKDPFAERAYAERQRSYADALHQRFIYTPQIVVNGMAQGVGSDRTTINALVEAARRAKNTGPTLAVLGDGTARTLRLGKATLPGPTSIWLAAFDRVHETEVGAGENGGQKLTNYNVVRVFTRIGAWNGNVAELPLDLAGVPASCDGAAILVQVDETGPILAALRFALPKPSN